MANFIRLMVSNYNEVLENVKDPTVDMWPLMGSPGPMLCIAGTYLIFVLKAGPKMMEKRPAFELKTVMILYNACQVLFSIWLVSLAVDVGIGNLFFFYGCNIKDHLPLNPKNGSLQAALARGAWWYFFSKIIELLDTIFFVLRKKQNQVTFLHVYHHVTTVIYSWCYLKWLPGEQGIVVGLLNSSVHIIMYSYYLIAALGSTYRKYLWWKKYMTWIQLLQFVIIFCYMILTLAMDCPMTKVLSYFFLINVTIFIYLFGDFYRKAYKKKTI